MKYAQVTKILFKEDNTAYGVQFDRHGKTLTAYATREVILSAGSIGTPKILMLSGIGPRSHLEELNIPVKYDLPVGRNLQDHLGVYLSPFFINQPRTTFVDRDITPASFVKWFTSGKGHLSSTGCEATGLFASSYAKARGEANWPDSQLFLYSFAVFRIAPPLLAKSFNLKEDEIVKYYRSAIGIDASHVIVTGSRPLSRGYIKLGGNSPYDSPIIDPNYLGDPDNVDLKVLLEALKKAVIIMENSTAYGVELGGRFTKEILPGCEDYEFRSDAYWICFIRRYSITLHHPVGTASMGKVVDTELRVYGTKNLRVMDASVQPFIVTTNTQASTMMIGEKGVDMVLRQWNRIRQHEGLLEKQQFWLKHNFI